MVQELKYYHGESSNPYEEVTETQGLHCQRYNVVASMLWCFEYHWANGWSKYKQLQCRNRNIYFEVHPQPQKDFANIQEALRAFSIGSHAGLLRNGSPRWLQYVYDNAMRERFYKPTYNIVPADEVPAYLHWYKGEADSPYQHEPANSTKGFWWNFEMNWYRCADTISETAWNEYLHGWLVRCFDTPWHAIPKTEQEKLITAYKAGKQVI